MLPSSVGCRLKPAFVTGVARKLCKVFPLTVDSSVQNSTIEMQYPAHAGANASALHRGRQAGSPSCSLKFRAFTMHCGSIWSLCYHPARSSSAKRASHHAIRVSLFNRRALYIASAFGYTAVVAKTVVTQLHVIHTS